MAQGDPMGEENDRTPRIEAKDFSEHERVMVMWKQMRPTMGMETEAASQSSLPSLTTPPPLRDVSGPQEFVEHGYRHQAPPRAVDAVPGPAEDM